MNDLKYSFKKFIDVFKTKNSKMIFSVSKEIVVLTFILCFLKMPFIFCRDVVVDYFNKMNIENILDSIFFWLFEILYILFIILMFKKWLIKKFGANNND